MGNHNTIPSLLLLVLITGFHPGKNQAYCLRIKGNTKRGKSKNFLEAKLDLPGSDKIIRNDLSDSSTSKGLLSKNERFMLDEREPGTYFRDDDTDLDDDYYWDDSYEYYYDDDDDRDSGESSEKGSTSSAPSTSAPIINLSNDFLSDQERYVYCLLGTNTYVGIFTSRTNTHLRSSPYYFDRTSQKTVKSTFKCISSSRIPTSAPSTQKNSKTSKTGNKTPKTSKNGKTNSKSCYPTRSPTSKQPTPGSPTSKQPSQGSPTEQPNATPLTAIPTQCLNPEDCDYTRPPLPGPTSSPVVSTSTPTTKPPSTYTPTFDPGFCYLLDCPRTTRPTLN
jgi:hypothetical protein